MFQADTITYDTQKIADYQSDEKYDYLSQLKIDDFSWFDLIARWFNNAINSIFRGKFEQNVTTPAMIILFLLILGTVLYFLYIKRPELFMRSGKTAPIPYSIEEENIHHINFDKEIAAALQTGNYRLAIRMLYLQTLRFLSDSKLIDWQIHKTPMEYLYEVADNNMKPPFRVFTNHFLHVRYGNCQATPELYETMYDLQASIKKVKEGGTE